MINLEDLRLLDLLPSRITDKEMEALAYALDPELQEITAAIEESIIKPRIREQPESIIDNLAWEFHVDFYEPLGFDLDKKRALVKNSLDWHRRKGTKSVVEEIMRLLFFPDFRIEEWFEYGGRRYFFRAIAGSEPMTREDLGEVMKAIDVTKNERSWLDYIMFDYTTETQDFSATTPNVLIQQYIVCPEIPIPVDVSNYDVGTLANMTKEYIVVDNEPLAGNPTTTSAVVPTINLREHIAEKFIDKKATAQTVFAQSEIREEEQYK